MKPRQLAFWLGTACRVLWRSARASSVLGSMILLAVGSLIFLASMAVGVNDAMVRNSVGLYAGHLGGSELPADLSPQRLNLKGVRAVLKRVPLAGTLVQGGRYVPLLLIQVDPEAEKRSTALWRKTVQGRFLATGAREVFLSQHLASRLGVSVGDRVLFKPATRGRQLELTICGLYRTGIDALDRGVAFFPQGLLPAAGASWSAAIFLAPGVDPGRIKARYQSRLPRGLQFQTWAEQMPDLKQLIDLSYFSMSIVMVLVFGVVSLAVAGAFAIFILKNLREYGIMKAMGVSPWETGLLIAGEVMLLNLVACALGVLIGMAAVEIAAVYGIDLTRLTSYNRYFVVSGVIYPRLTAYSVALPPLLAFLCSLAAAGWPTLLVARKKAAEILRSL